MELFPNWRSWRFDFAPKSVARLVPPGFTLASWYWEILLFPESWQTRAGHCCALRCMNEDLHNSLKRTEWAGLQLSLSWLERAKDGAQTIWEGPCRSPQAVVGWAGCHSPWAALTSPFLHLVLPGDLLCRVSRGHFSSTDHFPRLKNAAGLDWNWCSSGTLCQHRDLGWKGDVPCLAGALQPLLPQWDRWVPVCSCSCYFLNPRKCHLDPQHLHLKINNQRKNTSQKKFLNLL